MRDTNEIILGILLSIPMTLIIAGISMITLHVLQSVTDPITILIVCTTSGATLGLFILSLIAIWMDILRRSGSHV